jgi:hypothetical protein
MTLSAWSLFFIVMLNGVMLSVVMLNAVILSAMTPSAVETKKKNIFSTSLTLLKNKLECLSLAGNLFQLCLIWVEA